MRSYAREQNGGGGVYTFFVSTCIECVLYSSSQGGYMYKLYESKGVHLQGMLQVQVLSLCSTSCQPIDIHFLYMCSGVSCVCQMI